MNVVPAILIAVLVCSRTAGTQELPTPEAPHAEKIKAEVQRRGAGERSRVKVLLRNGAKAGGYISKIDDSSFALTNKKTGSPTTFRYDEVRKVQGAGLSKGAKIGIVAGVGVAVVAVVIAVAAATLDPPF